MNATIEKVTEKEDQKINKRSFVLHSPNNNNMSWNLLVYTLQQKYSIHFIFFTKHKHTNIYTKVMPTWLIFYTKCNCSGVELNWIYVQQNKPKKQQQVYRWRRRWWCDDNKLNIELYTTKHSINANDSIKPNLRTTTSYVRSSIEYAHLYASHTKKHQEYALEEIQVKTKNEVE